MPDHENDNDKTLSFVPLTNGTQIHHYKIISHIGAGGMGQVYLAKDSKLSRHVALKFLSPHLSKDPDSRTRFIREAKAAARLDHPHIVPVYEVGEFQGRPFFAMAHIEGRSLREYVQTEKPSVRDTIEIAIQLCQGLQAAHEKGVTHRDIKPSNILVDAHGRTRIVDFGLASLQDADPLTKTGSTFGTIGYMSPEQVNGKKVDHRSDLFSLGIVLYEMLAGLNPFKLNSEAATSHSITHDNPAPLTRYNRDIPDALQAIIDKVLEKDVSLRYQHADGMLSDLKRLLTNSLPVTKNRRRMWITLAATLAISVATLLYFTGSFITPAQSTEVPSIAFLLLKNLGPEDDQYLSYGITQDLIIDIARAGLIRVAPLKDVISLSIEELSIKEIAEKLHVRYIFDGTLLKDESGLHISAQLIDSRDGSSVWANKLHSTNETSPLLLGMLADSVLNIMSTKHDVTLNKEVARPKTADPKAYEYYLRGNLISGTAETEEDLRTALGLYKQAYQIDTTFYYAQLNQGVMHYKLNEYDASEAIYLSLIDKAIAIDDLSLYGKSLLNLGALTFTNGNLDEALGILEKALAVGSEINDKSLVGNVQNYLGVVHKYIGNADQAIEYLHKSTHLAQVLSDSSFHAETLNNLGSTFREIGEHDSALVYLSSSLKLSKQLNNKLMEAAAYFNLGYLYQLKGELQEAITYYNMNRDILHKLGDEVASCKALINIGDIHQLRGDFTQAKLCLDEALSTGTRFQLRMIIGSSYTYLSILYTNVGQYSKATQFCDLAMELSLDRGDKNNEMWAASRFGIILSKYPENDSLVKAAEWLIETKDMATQSHDQEALAFADGYAGIVNYRQENYEESIELLTSAIEISAGFDATDMELFFSSWLGLAALMQADTARAKATLQEVDILIRRPNFVWSWEDIATKRNLAQLYVHLGDSATARDYVDDAYEEIMKRYNMMEDEELRKNYLTTVRENREIIELWKSMHNNTQ